MTVQSIKANLGAGLAYSAIKLNQTGEWLGRQVTWVKEGVIALDIPTHLAAAWNQGFIPAFEWSKRNVIFYGGQLATLTKAGLNWSFKQTNAARHVIVSNGRAVLSEGSKRAGVASKATYRFLITNAGIAAGSGAICLGASITAFTADSEERKTLRNVSIATAVATALIAGFAIAREAPLLSGLA